MSGLIGNGSPPPPANWSISASTPFGPAAGRRRHRRPLTQTIPIVFAMADDPVRLGLVRTFSRPEANVTGVTSMNAETDAKRLGLLREVLPKLRRVGVVLEYSPFRLLTLGT